jgi:hypothetical protein
MWKFCVVLTLEPEKFMTWCHEADADVVEVAEVDEEVSGCVCVYVPGGTSHPPSKAIHITIMTDAITLKPLFLFIMIPPNLIKVNAAI